MIRVVFSGPFYRFPLLSSGRSAMICEFVLLRPQSNRTRDETWSTIPAGGAPCTETMSPVPCPTASARQRLFARVLHEDACLADRGFCRRHRDYTRRVLEMGASWRSGLPRC